MRKLLFFSLMVVSSHLAFADIASLQSNFVNGESSVVSHLNNDRTTLTNSVNNVQGCQTGGIQSAGQVKSATVCAENMAPDADPRTRTLQGAACEFVYTGLTTATTSGTLVGSISAGTAYPQGYYVNKNSSTAHTFNATKWTYVDIDKNGSFTYSEQTIGGAAPSVAPNSIRLERVSSDSTQILAVQDLRKTSCTAGPFSGISDATQEATLADIFVNGAGGWENGLSIASKSTTAIFINPGTLYLNGKYRTNPGTLSIDAAVVASPSNGQSGLDTGSLAASTNYYVYAAGDVAATSALTGVFSTSPTAPSGTTNYRRIGEASTEGASVFNTSTDVSGVLYSSVNYLGKIKQIKAFQTGAVATGTTVLPNDNTIAQINEGDEYLSAYITPISATDRIAVFTTMNINFANVANGNVAIFRGAPDAIGVCGMSQANLITMNTLTCHAFDQARTTNQIRYSVRAGTTSGTNTLNGTGGARLFGGAAASTLILVEYEP